MLKVGFNYICQEAVGRWVGHAKRFCKYFGMGVTLSGQTKEVSMKKDNKKQSKECGCAFGIKDLKDCEYVYFPKYPTRYMITFHKLKNQQIKLVCLNK